MRNEDTFKKFMQVPLRDIARQAGGAHPKGRAAAHLLSLRLGWLQEDLSHSYLKICGGDEAAASLMRDAALGTTEEDMILHAVSGQLDAVLEVLKEHEDAIKLADHQRQAALLKTPSGAALELFNCIAQIDGFKRVVVTSSDTDEFFISSSGEVTHLEHEEGLSQSLLTALIDDGFSLRHGGQIFVWREQSGATHTDLFGFSIKGMYWSTIRPDALKRIVPFKPNNRYLEFSI